MPNLLEDLIVDRIDFVDEGSNSAAFIELYKRKENRMEFSEILSKLKPEHASVIQQKLEEAEAELQKSKADLETANGTIAQQKTELEEATEALAKANAALKVYKEKEYCECDGEADENGICKACGRAKKSTGFDEAEVIKAMPEAARAAFLKMRAQKEAAEEQVRKAAEEKAEAEAVAKAATMKSLPVEQSVLVGILKGCDQSIADVLSAAAAAIDSAVLGEVGKAKPGTSTATDDAWSKIESAAKDVATRDGVTIEKAISTVIKEKPELYKEYLNGGAE